MIIETRALSHLLFVSMQAPNIKGAGYSTEDYMAFLVRNIHTRYTRVFIDMDQDVINGFVVLSVVDPVPGKEEVFIDLAWTRPGTNGLAQKFQALAELWAKRLGINKVSMVATRGIEAYKKIYGYKTEGTILSKTIRKESANVRTIQTNERKD